ncbi:MAG TPA: ATP-grasp domain-containing protein [archaeon]|nr:ATP-grasp domain-containing protein [archaeon]
MKFLIQKIDKELRHDFTFTLMESIRYQQWYHKSKDVIKYKFFNTKSDENTFIFNDAHKKYVPVGSVEFVTSFLEQFYGVVPKPLNVPEELFHYAGRKIYNGTEKDLPRNGYWIAKSNNKINEYISLLNCNTKDDFIYIPANNYQFSESIRIDSQRRCFIYNGKLVGIQHYLGDFKIFPNIMAIEAMIIDFKSAPIAYTLDVGINKNTNTVFLVEAHDFFSCGLYGFADHRIYPQMLYRWFREYTNNSEKESQHGFKK